MALALTVAALPAIAQDEKDEPKPYTIYMFGFARSFTDSIAYQTQICTVDSAYLNKYGFLVDRTLYSLQLQYHIETAGNKNAICSVFFDKKPSRLKRKWAKVQKRHKQTADLKYREIPLSEFTFKAEEYRPIIMEESK